jgi:hypothetical protein
VIQAGTGKAVVVSGSVAELCSRYYDADFFEEDALGAEVQRVSVAVQGSIADCSSHYIVSAAVYNNCTPSVAFC